MALEESASARLQWSWECPCRWALVCWLPDHVLNSPLRGLQGVVPAVRIPGTRGSEPVQCPFAQNYAATRGLSGVWRALRMCRHRLHKGELLLATGKHPVGRPVQMCGPPRSFGVVGGFPQGTNLMENSNTGVEQTTQGRPGQLCFGARSTMSDNGVLVPRREGVNWDSATKRQRNSSACPQRTNCLAMARPCALGGSLLLEACKALNDEDRGLSLPLRPSPKARSEGSKGRPPLIVEAAGRCG